MQILPYVTRSYGRQVIFDINVNGKLDWNHGFYIKISIDRVCLYTNII